MSDFFIGEIRVFSGGTLPRYWHLCDGTLLSIQQNQALYSLLGTAFGGDGRTTFGLPDLRGACILGVGLSPEDPTKTTYALGAYNRAETATATLPPHTHQAAFSPADPSKAPKLSVTVSGATGSETTPGNNLLAQTGTATGAVANTYVAPSAQSTTLGGVNVTLGLPASGALQNPVATSVVGTGTPFNVMPPYQAISYMIALSGVYPSRP